MMTMIDKSNDVKKYWTPQMVLDLKLDWLYVWPLVNQLRKQQKKKKREKAQKPGRGAPPCAPYQNPGPLSRI
jgi:hypothetical protein